MAADRPAALSSDWKVDLGFIHVRKFNRSGWVFVGPIWISWGRGFTGRFGWDWGVDRV